MLGVVSANSPFPLIGWSRSGNGEFNLFNFNSANLYSICTLVKFSGIWTSIKHGR